MDKKTFLGLLNTQVESITNASEGKLENETLLKTIKLLLDKINCTEDTLSEYGKLELRKLFASFGAVAQTACDFYVASKDHLDPAALQGEIGKKLENAKSENERVSALIDIIEQDSEKLLSSEKELTAKNATYEALSQKVDELQKIYQLATDERIQSLKDEVEELNDHIKKNKAEAINLESSIKELSDSNAQLKLELDALIKKQHEHVSTKDSQEKEILHLTSQIKIMQDEIEQKKVVLQRTQNELEVATASHNEQRVVIENALIQVKSNYDLYSQHIEENKQIILKLKNKGVDVSSMEKHIKSIESEFAINDEQIMKYLESLKLNADKGLT